jgi:hypothetical protein
MNKYSKLRDDLINKSREELMEFARAYQGAVLKRLENWFPTLEYDPENQTLLDTVSNYGKVLEIDKIRDLVAAKEGKELVEWFSGSLKKLADLNGRYFSTIDPKRAIGAQRSVQESLKKLYTRIGYDGNKAIRSGFLFDLTMSADPIRKIKAEAFRAIGAGSSYRDFLQQISITINGQKAQGKSGLFETHFRTAAYDSFAQFDRQIANKTAADLGLNYAIYSGGLMETSRDFCIERNGLVYTREEIMKWTDLTWKGKSSPYNPLLDLGGYNCTHKLDWISNRLGKKLKEEQDAKPPEEPTTEFKSAHIDITDKADQKWYKKNKKEYPLKAVEELYGESYLARSEFIPKHPEIHKAIQLFTADSDYLRLGTDKWDEAYKNHRAWMQMMVKASRVEDIVVYRGIKLNSVQFEKYQTFKKGDVLKFGEKAKVGDDTFDMTLLSSSQKQSVAEAFIEGGAFKVMLTVVNKNGIKGLPIKKLSGIPSEMEIVIGDNFRYQILEIAADKFSGRINIILEQLE